MSKPVLPFPELDAGRRATAMNYRVVVIGVLLLAIVGTVSAATITLYANNSSASSTGYTITREDTAQTLASLYSNSLATRLAYGSYVNPEFDSTITPDTYNWAGRGVVIFPTDELPDGSTVNSVILGLYHYTPYNHPFNASFTITKFDIDGAPSYDDFDNFGSTRYITDVNRTDVTKGAYNNYTLNAYGVSNISTTSATGFGIRYAHDVDLTEPTWLNKTYEFITLRYSAGYYPYLEIDYTEPTPTATPTTTATMPSYVRESSTQSAATVILASLPMIAEILVAVLLVFGLISRGDFDLQQILLIIVSIGAGFFVLYLLAIIMGSLSIAGGG